MKAGSKRQNPAPTLWCSLLLIVVALPLAATAEQAPPGSSPEQETVDYVIQDGDTCEAIAERLYGDARFYYVILESNNLAPSVIRSVCDRSLRPGNILRLPRRIPASRRPADARVSSVLRKVRSRSPSAPSWNKALPGQKLYRGWRVNTLERSEARLTFSDMSKVHLREETLVIIYGPTARDLRRRTSKATLERGTLRAHLSELSGRNELDVETPIARAELRGGSAVVSVDSDATSRVANHTGRPARVLARRGGRALMLRAGMGTTVRRGREPTPPRPLLSAPRWVPNQPRFVVVLGRSPTGNLRGAWHPVEGARAYRVELSSTSETSRLLGSTGTSAAVHSFELRGFPPGDYAMTVAAIDDEELESLPSPPQELSIFRLEIALPPFVNAELPSGSTPGTERIQLPAGTTITAPEGLRCAIGAGPPARALILSGRGVATLQCHHRELGEAPRLLLEIHPLELRALRTTTESEDQVSRLARGDSLSLLLDGIDVRTVPVEEIHVEMGAGLTLESAAPTAEGQLLLQLRVSEDAPRESSLEVQLRPPGRRRVILGRLTLGIDAPPPREATPAPPAEPQARSTPLPELSSLFANPASFGVEDVRRRGSGVIVAASAHFARADDELPNFALTLGGRIALADERIRLDVKLPIGLEQTNGGAALAVSSLIASRDVLAAALSFAAWLPFGRAESESWTLRFMPSALLAWRFAGRLSLRTRQGLIADAASDGELAWASAYAVDLQIRGPFVASLESQLTLGSHDGQLLVASWVGAMVALSISDLTFGLGVLVALSDDAADLSGRVSLGLSLRSASLLR